ncbi:MAG: hypothetical protein Q3960_00865 [Lactobacillus sp.]|nr:hypothetical protein [Lactobacillus sp.]
MSEYQAEICSDLRYAMRYATIKSEKVEMMVLDDQIYFRPRIIKENLLAPKGVTLSLTMDHKIVIKDDGMVNANNIYLHSSHEEKVIHLQLGWGQLIYES